MVAAGQIEIAAVEAPPGPGGEEALGLAAILCGFIAAEGDDQRRRAVRDLSDRAHPVDLPGAQAERTAIDVVVSAEARRQAAAEQAETNQIQTESEANRVRLLALAEADAEKQRAEAADVRSAVEARAQRAMHEADTALTPELIELKVRMAIVERLREIIGETVKPLENIEGIKIVRVDDLGAGSSGSGGSGGGGGPGNYAEQLTDSALRYRAQAPIVDALLKEIGMPGADPGRLADMPDRLSNPPADPD